MPIHLDATSYLQRTTDPDWGSAGTIFLTFYYTGTPWASDFVDHHAIFKSAATYAGEGFFYDKYTDNQAYVGWLTLAGDRRITLSNAQVAAAFPANQWHCHLFDWDSGAPIQRFYSDNVMIASRADAFTVPTGLNYLTIGVHFSAGVASPTGGLKGDVGGFGRWNRILTDNEKLTLQATCDPLSVPNGLVHYHRWLNQDHVTADLAGGSPLTKVDALLVTVLPMASTVEHPMVVYTESPAHLSFEGASALILEPPLLSSPITLFAPSLSQAAPAGVLQPPLLSSPVTLFPPSLSVAAPPVGVGVSTYPPDIDTPSNLIIAANNKRSTVASELSISGTVLTVADASTWPTSGAITLDVPVASRTPTSSEICYYGARSGNVLTLTARAQGGTSAKVWAVGMTVEMRAIAEHHNLHSSAIIALQTEVETKAGISHTHPHLPLAGGTLTGPLTLAGLPSSDLHAASKSYVDSSFSSSSATLPSTYLVTNFGASGSIVTTTGTITSGSNQLTVASPASFAIGHGISIVGAGAAGVLLVSTISAIAGSVFTLADNATVSVSGASVKHDDTAAIQSALNTVCANGGGELLFPQGYYRCNRALQVSSNSILNLPFRDSNTTSPIAIKLTGLSPISWFTWNAAVPQTDIGCIIQSDVIGLDSNSSIFAAAKFNDTSTGVEFCTHIMVYIDQLRFRTYDNPQLSGLDLAMAGGAHIGFVSIETSSFWGPEPTLSMCFGLRMPKINTTMALSGCDMAYVHNYDTGVFLNEMPVYTSNNFFVMRCKFGYRVMNGYYPICGLLFAWECPYGIEIRGLAQFNINFFAEDAQTTAGWVAPITHILDAGFQCTGRVAYHIHESYSAIRHTIVYTGCPTVAFINLGA